MYAPKRSFVHLLVALFALAVCTGGPARAMPGAPVIDGIPGLREAMLDAGFWIDRLEGPDTPILDRAGVAALNLRTRTLDRAILSPLALPDRIDRERVRAWIDGVSRRPTVRRYTREGSLPERDLDALVEALALDRLPAHVTTRFGLVTRRADLRAFPTALRVFSAPDDTDIDRFQEDALFPGAPVAVLHASRDGAWLFVVSERYAAWVSRDAVAIGPREQVADYVARADDGLVVTGASVLTVYTPEHPAVSAVQLEMGVRVPHLAWPATAVVNGQTAAFGHVIELPVRDAAGALAFAPALVPRSADVATDVLPLTRATLVRQGFKFLGERYGWGHSYNARDCSGFVSEVYRSAGVLLPRNTGAQAVSPAFDRVEMPAAMSREARLGLLRAADAGDLVFVPGHVMMVIGHVDGEPWVIHDTAGMSVRDDEGDVVRVPFNGVVVTPLTPMRSGDDALIDHVTSLLRVR
ncbi:SH3 domain-containing protein [Luteimonas deserti]|uniref:SH3 domain-containing protein n=1 Tax=Luteimonas deserti TaxID=2752306 RepID=A0A7Z0QSD8_9GAMM|nr:SH3 domain-containing protein [Luteimonas deserti]NYZ63986.1 SH3 domain-containing protein [Luteimonas deserti]